MAENDSEKGNRFAVLDVFGLKLEVSNPRLAELLTMDAKQALASDVRELVHTEKSTIEDVRQAVPDVILSPSTPHTEEIARYRKEFRQRVEDNARRLGFEVRGDGLWVSATGISIMTRTLERPLSLAAASHFVSEVAQHFEGADDELTSVLFVVDDQQTANVFKVAIRQRGLYKDMRTVSVDNLEDMRDLYGHAKLTHEQIVTLLAPVANIDVGEVLSVIHADGIKTTPPTESV
ncbi:MAG: hypothetical protein Q7J82_09775 [Coriobacteriia bacterium]|nr:hypothetical protein [Coriobacteriia bacterium]